MKKIFVLVLFLALSFGLGFGYALAQEESAAQVGEEITVQDLGVEDPGMLPTSPFYFFKNWTRAIKRTFTFNAVKKADLEINITNEQAAEIKKMREIAPEKVEAIAKAAENYQTNVERLKNRIEALRETSENPNVDKLLEKLTDRSIKHQQLFDELKQKFENKAELKQKFKEMQEESAEIMAKIPEKFENSEAFKERMRRVLENQPEKVFKELRGAEIIDRIGEKLSEKDKEELEDIKEKLFENFEKKIDKLPEVERKRILMPENLEKLSGDFQQRVKILEEMKSRIEDSEIKEELEDIKKEILENQAEKMEIREETVEKIIAEVKNLISKFENFLATEEIPAEINRETSKKLINAAKSKLAEAEKALSGEKMGEAFGQAVAARAVAQNALRQIMRPILLEKMSQPAQPNEDIDDDQDEEDGDDNEQEDVQDENSTEINADAINSLPKILPIGRCGDGVCDLIEKERGLCLADCR